MSEDRIVTSHELAEEIKASAKEVFSGKTGFPTLDRLLEGVEEGELVIVTGPTGEGKTTMLMSITANLASHGIDGVWFTLEVTPRQFIKKMLKGNNELPMFYIPRRGFDDADIELVRLFEKQHNRKFQMIDWLELKIKEAMGRESNLKAVFIDHIHQIFRLERVERSISLEIGDMVAKIKNMALKYGLVIFLVAHSRDDHQNTMREPRKEDIRDSGLISRLADTIIGVWRITNDADGSSTRRKEINQGDNRAKIRVFKNRRTGELGWFVALHKDHKLTELEDKDWGNDF
jgi:replicative DNA helicase